MTRFAALIAVASVAFSHAGAAADAPAAEPRKSLDLSAPDVTKLLSAEQLKQLLAEMETKIIEDVEVERKKDSYDDGANVPWSGIAAPVWALLNPLQSWRIFAPIPPKQAEAMTSTPDATSPNRPRMGTCQMSPC